MKFNTKEVAVLQPDYLGFIFYEKSKRNFEDAEIPNLPKSIQKVGVFVDAEYAFAKANILAHNLDIIQLHGSESPLYIEELKNELKLAGKENLQWWKVFGIEDSFDFKKLFPYQKHVDAFLFDTKGKEKGGNGYTFDWSVLEDYNLQTPIVLSGGIGLDQIEGLKKILKTDLPITAIDVNSKFETKPGLKVIDDLKELKKLMDVNL
ncbi:phosphoribosylanthranilate isomerase [Dokdonia sp. Hel_I_53]|uniref:phosphoribosylanthranilate isomerase n=1 Tax=Dokdonia sp. Hel_I_53 TaxID=1566287 RepID=UPI0021BD91BA|nr:phosphoribosylanthranilate isomerase [Dokdonia sp. Hel_I_53]